jgi:hypothetical protein
VLPFSAPEETEVEYGHDRRVAYANFFSLEIDKHILVIICVNG